MSSDQPVPAPQDLTAEVVLDLAEFGQAMGRRILASARPDVWTTEDGERLLQTLREAGVKEEDIGFALKVVLASAKRTISLRVRMPLWNTLSR